jgi:putative endonuclease
MKKGKPISYWTYHYRSVFCLIRQFGKCVFRFFDDLRSQCSRDPLERCRWLRFPSPLQNVSDRAKDQLGRAGEAAAAAVLEQKGFRILQRNILLPGGELDLVARQNRTLVFVEIKTRQDRQYGEPVEAVGVAKQRRQMVLAQQFLSLCGVKNTPIRFDIVSIVWSKDCPPQIEHIENAFLAQDCQ